MRAFCLILFLFELITASAQAPLSGMYRAKNGHIVISGKMDTTAVAAQSDQLLIVLNCEGAEMTARVDINTLSTGEDRFDSLLSASRETAFFIGQIEVDIINSPGPLPIEFDIGGILTLNSTSRPMVIKARIDNIPDNQNAGMFLGEIAISLNDFNLRSKLPFLSDLLIIQFSQVLLKRVCE